MDSPRSSNENNGTLDQQEGLQQDYVYNILNRVCEERVKRDEIPTIFSGNRTPSPMTLEAKEQQKMRLEESSAGALVETPAPIDIFAAYEPPAELRVRHPYLSPVVTSTEGLLNFATAATDPPPHTVGITTSDFSIELENDEFERKIERENEKILSDQKNSNGPLIPPELLTSCYLENTYRLAFPNGRFPDTDNFYPSMEELPPFQDEEPPEQQAHSPAAPLDTPVVPPVLPDARSQSSNSPAVVDAERVDYQPATPCSVIPSQQLNSQMLNEQQPVKLSFVRNMVPGAVAPGALPSGGTTFSLSPGNPLRTPNLYNAPAAVVSPTLYPNTEFFSTVAGIQSDGTSPYRGATNPTYANTLPNVYANTYLSTVPHDPHSSVYLNAVPLGCPDLTASRHYLVHRNIPQQQPMQPFTVEGTQDLLASCGNSVTPETMASTTLSGLNSEGFVLSNASSPIITVPQAPPSSPYFAAAYPIHNGGTPLFNVSHITPLHHHQPQQHQQQIKPEFDAWQYCDIASGNVPQRLVGGNEHQLGGQYTTASQQHSQPNVTKLKPKNIENTYFDDNDEIPNDVKSSLVVFYVPKSWTLLRLHDTFAPFGRVLQYRLDTDPETGNRKGRGFIQFDCPESAITAMNALNGKLVEGNRRLKVQLKRFLSPRYKSFPSVNVVGDRPPHGTFRRSGDTNPCPNQQNNFKSRNNQNGLFASSLSHNANLKQDTYAAENAFDSGRFLPAVHRDRRPDRNQQLEQDEILAPSGGGRLRAQRGNGAIPHEHHYGEFKTTTNGRRHQKRLSQQQEQNIHNNSTLSSKLPKENPRLFNSNANNLTQTVGRGQTRESFEWLSSMIAMTVGNIADGSKTVKHDASPGRLSDNTGVKETGITSSLPVFQDHRLPIDAKTAYEGGQGAFRGTQKPQQQVASAERLDTLGSGNVSDSVFPGFGRHRSSSTHAELGLSREKELGTSRICDTLNMLVPPSSATTRHQRSASEGCCEGLVDEHSGDDEHIANSIYPSSRYFPTSSHLVGALSPRGRDLPQYNTTSPLPAVFHPEAAGEKVGQRGAGLLPLSSSSHRPEFEQHNAYAKRANPVVHTNRNGNRVRPRHGGRHGEGIIPEHNIFVFHIPPDWKEAHFRAQFSKFGPIRCLNFPKDSSTPWGHRGYGFICYESREDACRAIEEMDGKEIELGRRLKVEFKKPSNTKHRTEMTYSFGSPQQNGGHNESEYVPNDKPMGTTMMQSVDNDRLLTGNVYNGSGIETSSGSNFGYGMERQPVNDQQRSLNAPLNFPYNLNFCPPAPQYPQPCVEVQRPPYNGNIMPQYNTVPVFMDPVEHPSYVERPTVGNLNGGQGNDFRFQISGGSSQLANFSNQFSLRSGSSTSNGDVVLPSPIPNVLGANAPTFMRMFTPEKRHVSGDYSEVSPDSSRSRPQCNPGQPEGGAYRLSTAATPIRGQSAQGGLEYTSTMQNQMSSFSPLAPNCSSVSGSGRFFPSGTMPMTETQTSHPVSSGFLCNAQAADGAEMRHEPCSSMPLQNILFSLGTDSFPSTSSSLSRGTAYGTAAPAAASNSTPADWNIFSARQSVSGGSPPVVLNGIDLQAAACELPNVLFPGTQQHKTEWRFRTQHDLPILDIGDALAAAVTANTAVSDSGGSKTETQ